MTPQEHLTVLGTLFPSLIILEDEIVMEAIEMLQDNLEKMKERNGHADTEA